MIETIIKKITEEYSRLKEKAIKLYVNYENEDELKKYGKFIHKGLFYGKEWKTMEVFEFKGKPVFSIDQKIGKSIQFRIHHFC